MDKTKIKQIQERIIKDLSLTHTDLKAMSPIEKFQFANGVLTNCRDFCCEKWGINPQAVQTLFCLNLNSYAETRPNMAQGNGAIVFNTVYALNTINPLRLYKTAFHEMRHIHQFLVQPETSSERQVNYTSLAKLSGEQWASSSAEKGADKFAYTTMYSLIAKSVLRGKLNPFAIETRKFVSRTINDTYKHIKGSVLYSRQKSANQDFATTQKPTHEEITAYHQKLFYHDIKLLGLLSNMFKNQFQYKNPNMTGEDRHLLTAKVGQIIQAYKDERDLAFKEGRLNSTPIMQIHQSMVERLRRQDAEKKEQTIKTKIKPEENTEQLLSEGFENSSNNFKNDKPNGSGAKIVNKIKSIFTRFGKKQIEDADAVVENISDDNCEVESLNPTAPITNSQQDNVVFTNTNNSLPKDLPKVSGGSTSNPNEDVVK